MMMSKHNDNLVNEGIELFEEYILYRMSVRLLS